MTMAKAGYSGTTSGIDEITAVFCEDAHALGTDCLWRRVRLDTDVELCSYHPLPNDVADDTLPKPNLTRELRMVDLPLDDVTRFGLHSRVPSPAYARELVTLAEETGLTSIAVGDHLAFALPIDDSILGLGMIATLSEKITIATSVYLLPLRHPALVAKQTITLARMAPGRFIFGVGVGGEFPGEFALAGIPHNERGARLNEGIEIVRKLWIGEPVAYEGRFYSFPETQLRPAPEPAGGPPIWVGGRSKAALKRAATLCDGWIFLRRDTRTIS